MNLLEHIRTIPLAGGAARPDEAPTKPPVAQPMHRATTVVVEGILLTQGADLGPQAASDTCESVLFAQLAADHVAQRTADPEAWYQVYTTTLTTLGWTEASHSAIHSDKPPPIDWQRTLLASFPSSMKKAATAAVTLARALPDDAPARQVWSKAVSGPTAIDFSVAVVTEREDSPWMAERRGVARMMFAQTGFIDWSARFEFDSISDDRWLSEDIYANLRSTVKERLGDRIARYIIPVG